MCPNFGVLGNDPTGFARCILRLKGCFGIGSESSSPRNVYAIRKGSAEAQAVVAPRIAVISAVRTILAATGVMSRGAPRVFLRL